MSPPTTATSAPPLAGRVVASGLPPQPTTARATSALVRETDREIELEITGFETIPKIYAKEGNHDLPEVQSRAHADRILERRGQVVLRIVARGVRQVGAIGVGRAAEEGRVARVEEPERADRQPEQRQQRERVLEVCHRAQVAAELIVEIGR